MCRKVNEPNLNHGAVVPLDHATHPRYGRLGHVSRSAGNPDALWPLTDAFPAVPHRQPESSGGHLPTGSSVKPIV